MKSSSPFLALACLAALACPMAGAELEPASLFQTRDGLPNLAAKLKAGTPVTLVFIGGSITEAASTPKGFVTFIGEWLGKTYPGAKATLVNAGIPGTGSDFGVARCDRDVLVHKPDAVFIEFAVNDGDKDRTECMERLVHKIWLKNPVTDIVFFYTLDRNHLGDYKAGKLPFAASAHERVAAFYGIPTFGTAFLAALRINGGVIPWDQFSGDGCHPKQSGYEIFDEVFAQALPECLKVAPARPHTLGRSITPNLHAYLPRPDLRPLTFTGDLVSTKGEKAVTVFPMPSPGNHWVDKPVYAGADGKPLWKLSWLPNKLGGKLDPALGSDRTAWEGNSMEWFDEYAFFSAPKGRELFGRWLDKGSISFRNEIAVLRFIAPTAGRYTVSVKSGPWNSSGSDEKEMSLTVQRFARAGGPGVVLATQRQAKKDAKGLDIAADVALQAGDELTFIPDTNAGGGTWESLVIGVGRIGD